MPTVKEIYNKTFSKIDLPFLLFLITLSGNKIYLKVFALILIFALRPRLNWQAFKSLPLFYPLLVVIAFLQFLFFGGDFSGDHLLVFGVGMLYWILCYLYLYQTYLFVNTNGLYKVNNTIITFVSINLIVLLGNFISICISSHSFLPFWVEGDIYGASSGDYLTGLFGRPSYINAFANMMFALYFTHMRRMGWFLLALFTAMISFANIFNLIFMVVLLVYLILANTNRQRVFIAGGIVLCFLMYKIISPYNYDYLQKTIGLSVSEKKEIMPQVVIKTTTDTVSELPTRVKYRNDSAAANEKIAMIDRMQLFTRDYSGYKTFDTVDISRSPGKKIAILQTLKFFRDQPQMLLVGAGMGNFSSRLAFQFSGRDSSRMFQKLPKYAHGYYYKNHLLIYDSMRQLPNEYHSIKHFPNNFFSQLCGEYGLAGLVIFIVFYLGYFFRRAQNKKFFFILLFAAGSFLMLDYFYEFFNVMVIFEMLLLINCLSPLNRQQQDPV